jgi:hypothetical protein
VNAAELPSWRETATTRSILEFVDAVTTAGSPDFVPEADRVAVFDNDGTLSSEMPMYTQLAFALVRAAELGKPTTVEELKAGGLGLVLELLQLTHGSVTTDEFAEAVRAWVAVAAHPVTGAPYPEMVFQPMVELVGALEVNGFDCWIFSGGGTDFMRAWAPTVFGVAPHRMIGSVGKIEFEDDGDDGPRLLKGSELVTLDDGPQKAISIHQYIGQRPILAAGNTDGDLQMLEWTAAGPHRSLQLAIHHTDAVREVAYDVDPLLGAGTDKLLDAAAAGAWSVVDMAADWATIFGGAGA